MFEVDSGKQGLYVVVSSLSGRRGLFLISRGSVWSRVLWSGSPGILLEGAPHDHIDGDAHDTIQPWKFEGAGEPQ